MTKMIALAVVVVSGVLLFSLYKWLKFPSLSVERSQDFVKRSLRGPIAHRASSPENTLAGIRKAKKEGASAVELDLSFTQDGVAVLLHDQTVDRTSNGHGRLSALTIEQARKLDFGYKFGTEYVGERIAILEEALCLCQELELLVYLEVKTQSTRAAAAIRNCFKKHPSFYQLVTVISFYPWCLYAVRKADPNINCGMTMLEKFMVLENGKYITKPKWKVFASPLVDRAILWCIRTWFLDYIGVHLLLPHKDMILSGKIDPTYWKRRNVSLVTWTVNNPADKQIMAELQIPFLTDSIDPNSTAPEQFGQTSQ